MRRRAAARGEFLPRLRASCERAQDGEEARERSRDGEQRRDRGDRVLFPLKGL